jgi:hypothetical protein
MPERTARWILADLVDLGLLASDTPKGKVSLRFPARALWRICLRGFIRRLDDRAE